MARESFSPKWCPHVSGTYSRDLDADGNPEPTWVELSCSKCGDAHRVKCESGAPRHWVQLYAQQHVHRDALKEQFPGGTSR